MRFIAATFIVLTVLSASCRNENHTQQVTNTDTTADASSASCYSYTSGKDTVALHLTMHGNAISGDLIYNFYEKDRNTGTISGSMHGDTLIADYTFMSEGMESVRKVAFLKTGANLLEGHSMADQSGVMDYTHSYDFDNGIMLKHSNDCGLYFPGKK
jgi:hypothetical protein